ncbi:MAG: hypothetical protein R3359_12675, partial [Marinirhabdus sp.]|nr:hypothetical protein [Marinirhabdus sp.]
PNTEHVAAVRLDTTGLQRLYTYASNNGTLAKPQLLLEDVEVAYFAFNDEQQLMASVLAGGQLDLVLADLQAKEVVPYLENAGRSIHNVPGSESMSYTVVNEDKNHEVYLLDLRKPEETYFACQLPIGIQDHTWLNRDTLLIGSRSKLYTYNLFEKGDWTEVADLSSYGITNITRITVSPDGKKLAFAAEVE